MERGLRLRSRPDKQAVVQYVDRLAPAWQQLALRIHAHPEPGLQEVRAATWLTDQLAAEGFAVRRNVAGLKTAFIARQGRNAARPVIAFIAEYDALPGLGHACSHNLIGAASGLAAAALGRAMQGARGAILVIGCPGEEFYGGKVRLLERGVFKEIDVALMAHGYFLTLGSRPTIGRASVILEFFGRASHASSAPERGINALDAVLQTFNNINALRQQIRSEARVHGIITDGGSAANIIPDYARAEFYVRSRSPAYLRELKRKVVSCARAAALATGARLKVSSEGYEFEPTRPNTPLARAYEENMGLIGEAVDRLPVTNGFGSSDFGNLSRRVPALHGYFRITNRSARPHTPEFAAACRRPAALRGMVKAAKALALTAFDLLHDRRLLSQVRQDFLRQQELEREDERA